MDLHALPILGRPLVLHDDAGNALALGTSADDSAFLCVVVEDAAGRRILRNLIDGDCEALLLAMLWERVAVRAAHPIPRYRAGAGR